MKNLNRANLLRYYEKFMIVVGTAGQGLFYLQAYKIFRKGCADDVSLEGFLLALFSLTCWLIYGVFKKDKVIVVVNAFALIGAILTVLAIILVT